jgi:hypothetical protein
LTDDCCLASCRTCLDKNLTDGLLPGAVSDQFSTIFGC